MYWIPWTLFILLIGVDVIEWRRFRELLPVGMAGLVTAGVQLGLPEFMGASLFDIGPISSTAAVTLLLQSLGGPVFAMWFAQRTTPERVPVLRVLHFTALSFCVERVAYAAGRLAYTASWHLGWSLLYNVTWYLVIWKVHAFCLTGTARAGQAVEKPHP
jgi:hypothetical protein